VGIAHDIPKLKPLSQTFPLLEVTGVRVPTTFFSMPLVIFYI
jgi:hypothetical protein